jgi:uncharacterized protein (DUF427 family)
VGKIVRVEFAGIVIAESSDALRVLETASPPTVYIPPSDVKLEYLEPTHNRSFCEWKGEARYWSIRVGSRVAADAVWGYPDPSPAFARIKDYFSFYPGRVDACFIGDDRVEPQPGDFYGGWITPSILGPFKGDPGTGFW